MFFILGVTHIDSTTKKHRLYITDSKAVKHWADYYAKEYKIPIKIVYNILKKETNWKEKDTLYIAEQVGDHKLNKKGKKIEGS